jgi:hypothetical protein
MVILTKQKDFPDGTANYNFNYDEAFYKFVIEQTGAEKPTQEQVKEFLGNLIFEAAGESYTEFKEGLGEK